MQVPTTASALNAVARPLVGEQASRNAQERGAAAGGKAANLNAQANANRKAENTPATKEAASVSKSSTTSAAPPPPVAVYAEIWVGGKKVGEVDVNGGVSLPSIPASLQLSSGNSGPALARLRSEEVARALGGEVRYNGEAPTPPSQPPASSGDPKVDRMRAKINAMYGASLGS
jgi:hypothetical protein